MNSINLKLLLTSLCTSLSLVHPALADAPKYITEHPPAVSEVVQSAVQANMDVSPVELFETSRRLFSVTTAPDQETIDALMKMDEMSTAHMIEVQDINSPARGGGPEAGANPRPGHKTFVIKRPIPGVGKLPEEKKVAIAKGSNAAIAKIGDSIEWVHSYLTAEGTYCVYRAVDEATIREHGRLAGAPILDVYQVN